MNDIMNGEVYSENKNTQVLEHGTHKNYDYYIVSYSSHPCCYIALPKEHPCYGMDYDEIQYEIGIDCYGGLTYGEDYLLNLTGKWFIGWDYAHSGDFRMLPWGDEYGRKHSLDELREDVHIAIETLSENINDI